ncbi:MAG TPA: hypothetical protein IAD32_05880 [Candidatus Scatavimonas merdigallinarum]|uniref:Uncharacterized protein n=1 Tax=Candidatus Scatavimonas merdigallinarum TaxID=2840914 RepID=A0A9D1CUR5_9FIRM|nr:hypothetical protein [Candidatus Scatavimonas merdigallinarum]
MKNRITLALITDEGENMLFGLLKGDVLLIIGAVLSFITVLLFWRVKKNSL